MDREWDDSQPIYRQLRDRVVGMILEGVLKEADPLPSVRTVATDYRLNPLTVLKAYQQLVDEKLVEMKRGRGMFVNAGARCTANSAQNEDGARSCNARLGLGTACRSNDVSIWWS